MKSGKNFANKKASGIWQKQVEGKGGKEKNQGEEKAKSTGKQAQAKILRHGRGSLAMRNGLPVGEHKAGLRAYLRGQTRRLGRW